MVRLDGRPVDRVHIEVMNDSIAHRGPDGHGVLVRDGVGIGHRRLSIIDPVGGAQPMTSGDGEVWLTFNGEIYNYLSLRDQLQRAGRTFRTRSDTEVVLQAYEQWGAACVEMFRGMFAFAIVDWGSRQLFIARDHFGIKPLYYLQTSEFLAFASELGALREIAGGALRIDPAAIDAYLCLQYVPTPKTAFREVLRLPPAHMAIMAMERGELRVTPYWNPSFDPDHSVPDSDWPDIIDEALRETVSAHMLSDVPFGVLLSGGIDSSLVLAQMAKLSSVPIEAFTVGFDDPEFDETPYAREAAERVGAHLNVRFVREDALDLVPRLVRHYGDLFGDSSAMPTFCLSEFARERYAMVLSGDGADEMFAGYWSYQDWMSFFDARGVRESPADAWLRFVSQMPGEQRRNLWLPEIGAELPQAIGGFEETFAEASNYSRCNQAQYMDLKSYLPNVILTKIDVASMAFGLEVRTPYVDVRLFELISSVPESLNIRRRGESWYRKTLLKRVAERYFPAAFVHRPKQGFAPPLAAWLSRNLDRNDRLREKLVGGGSALRGYFDMTFVERLLQDSALRPIWLLLVLEEFLSQNNHG